MGNGVFFSRKAATSIHMCKSSAISARYRCTFSANPAYLHRCKHLRNPFGIAELNRAENFC